MHVNLSIALQKEMITEYSSVLISLKKKKKKILMRYAYVINVIFEPCTSRNSCEFQSSKLEI